MIIAQSFFSFSEDRELLVIPMSNVTLLDHYPIYFTISWQPAIQWSVKTHFFLNMSVLPHASTIAHILHV